MYQSPVSSLALPHKLDTRNRFFVNLFLLGFWRMEETCALEEARDKTGKKESICHHFPTAAAKADGSGNMCAADQPFSRVRMCFISDAAIFSCVTTLGWAQAPMGSAGLIRMYLSRLMFSSPVSVR